MPDTQSLKILFVHNPKSGGKRKTGKRWLGNKSNWEIGIRQHLKHTPHKYEIYNINSSVDKQSVRYWIEKIKPDRLVAVGGDGTVKLVAEAAEGLDVPICIFPAGSANGMAKEIGMPNDVDDCMKVLLEGEIKSIHAILINEQHLCIHLSDIGINAQLVKYFEENDMRGKWGYAKEIARVLWRKRLMDVDIDSGHRRVKRKAFMVVIANASTYGTGAKINPLGNVHDQLFEVIILRKLSVTELMKMLFYNRKFNPKKTEIFQADRLEIRVKKRVYFQVDGEYLGKTDAITARVKPNALQLIFPK